MNGNLAPNGGWLDGWNSGVPNPTKGYHAHIDIEKFGQPVMSFINKNNEVPTFADNYQRWIGIRYIFQTNSELYKELKVGSELTVTWDMWSENKDGHMYGGIFQPQNVDTIVKGTKYEYVYASKEKSWEQVETKFTITEDFDFNKQLSIYLYGYGDNHVEKYIDNVKIRLKR